MITSFVALTTVTAPGKRTDVDVCFLIHRQANHPLAFISDFIGRMNMEKDFVSLCYFFLGLHLSTFFRRKPNSFNLLLMVRTVGNSS